LVIARRMTGPIRAIAEGAERIGAGELDRRTELHTGDELEALAEQFNRMGADIQKSYAELEQRVADRTAEIAEALDQQTATADAPGAAHERLIAGQNIAHLADIADSDDHRSGNPLPRAVVELGGARSLLAVALRREGVFFGAIVIYRREIRPFTDTQIALFQN